MKTETINAIRALNEKVSTYEQEMIGIKNWLDQMIQKLRRSLPLCRENGDIVLASRAMELIVFYEGMLKTNLQQQESLKRLRRETDEFLSMLASDRALGSA